MYPVSLLKPYYNNGKHQPPPPALLVDAEEEFEVEEILPHEPRSKTTGFVFFGWVTGKLFTPRQISRYRKQYIWESSKNMHNAPVSLREYWDRVAVQPASLLQATAAG